MRDTNTGYGLRVAGYGLGVQEFEEREWIRDIVVFQNDEGVLEKQDPNASGRDTG
jgi:hypothetical protein